jgi:HEAT repeat protein
MTEFKEIIDHYVRQLSTPQSENAWFSLVDEGPAALPYLVEAFKSNADAAVRIRLIQIICQYQSQDAIPFLTVQLNNHVPEIWKTALDGFVMLRSKEALAALETAIPTATADKREWIEEAIQQIHEANHEDR